MIRVLFMPLLQIPSGHHHVADTISAQLKQNDETTGEFYCEKLEILSHCYGPMEKLISSLYLKFIHTVPNIYSKLYKIAAVKGTKRKHYSIYDQLFLKKLWNAIREKNPHVVICSHALPSYLLNRLKEKKQWSGTVINVYTDYFVNDLWGLEQIDYHFAPCHEVKQYLMDKGIPKHRIVLTGIPIDPIFRNQPIRDTKKDKFSILISGGNMGAGSMDKLIHRLKPQGDLIYYVLCGKNKKLFQKLDQQNHPSIIPLPYLDSKSKMNQLYDTVDAVITKPGGVTITECLWKKLPILIYEALPGQEEFNLRYLIEQRFAFHLNDFNPPIEKKILEWLRMGDRQPMHFFHQQINVNNMKGILKSTVTRNK
ncbi:MGDG synthase family glycosyltransferase [Oceanobacillus senegalensis]|uniref:MGDG synthase family glycosyltransferase n=1 Tax=Oceanobacillus senegalensis TaxID=1936063 RepID=UPI000A30B94E|nr:glycosyltransferase [Oceanobacillus senegalensis]